MRRRLRNVLWNLGTLGSAAAGAFLVLWLLLGYASFGDLVGVGLLYAAVTGLICAVCAGGTTGLRIVESARHLAARFQLG